MRQELGDLYPTQGTGGSPIKAFENLCTFAERWGKHYRILLALSASRSIPTYLSEMPRFVCCMIFNRSCKRTLRICGVLFLLMLSYFSFGLLGER